jgi:hypothetical protein
LPGLIFLQFRPAPALLTVSKAPASSLVTGSIFDVVSNNFLTPFITALDLPLTARRSAALPATYGVAIDVHDKTAKLPFGKVDMIFPPGAENAGLNLKLKEGPYDEKSDMSPPCESGAPKEAPDCGKEMVMFAPAANCWTS